MLSAYVDGRLFGERFGTGSPTVLALHGWRSTHDSLRDVVGGMDAIALDLPGFGASPAPDDVWGAAGYADVVASVVDEVGGPLIVLGHSFGGRVAVNLAARHPHLVRSLVLTGAPLVRKPAMVRKPALTFRLVKGAHRLGIVSDERMEAERRKRGSADYRAATGVIRDIFVKLVNESYEDQLRAIACPVEMVWGENDTEAPLAQAEEARMLLNDARMTVVPGGSHWLPTESPEPLRAVIEGLLP